MAMKRWLEYVSPRGVIVGILALTWMWAGAVTLWPEPQATSYKPTEIQSLRLQVKQRDAWLAQKDAISAQQRYQAAVGALIAEGEMVRKEQGWPESVKFDADTITFAVPPEVPAGGRGK